MNQIKAITLHRPWAAGISHFGKDIENRSWQCPLPVGSYLAIHNGSKWDENAADFIRQHASSTALENYSMFLCQDREPLKGAIVAVAQFNGNVETSDSIWWIEGQIGWQLTNVVRIEPVWCSGQQKLWSLPDPILAQVRTNYQVACQLTKNPGSSSDSPNPNSIASNSSDLS
jgi:hypothetical protein